MGKLCSIGIYVGVGGIADGCAILSASFVHVFNLVTATAAAAILFSFLSSQDFFYYLLLNFNSNNFPLEVFIHILFLLLLPYDF